MFHFVVYYAIYLRTANFTYVSIGTMSSTLYMYISVYISEKYSVYMVVHLHQIKFSDSHNDLHFSNLEWLAPMALAVSHPKHVYNQFPPATFSLQITPMVVRDCSPHIEWPSLAEWRSLCGNWRDIPVAVGAIDATSHTIDRPIEEQEQFYSGHRHTYCVHTQVIIDNTKRLRLVRSGFMGSDTQMWTLMDDILCRII